jgi:prepilin peptidase CpaA
VSTVAIAVVLGFVMLCVLSDVRTRRIPNALSLTGVFAGLVLNLQHAGAAGLATSALGLGLAVALLIAPFAAGGIGGGDVKMMGALGAMLGPHLVVSGLLIGALLGGVHAAVCAARRGLLHQTLSGVTHRLGTALGRRSVEPLRMSAGEGTGLVLPYSLPLGAGAIVALLGG